MTCSPSSCWASEGIVYTEVRNLYCRLRGHPRVVTLYFAVSVVLCVLQGEPEFDRLKRELEEVKNQPRGLEGTFRTAAEMERHRAQLADAAIE